MVRTNCVQIKPIKFITGDRVKPDTGDMVKAMEINNRTNSYQMNWEFYTFRELSPEKLYLVLAERQAVFVVEQNCPFQEADGLDDKSRHLLGWMDNQLIAYARIVPPGAKFKGPSIGRILTTRIGRGKGFGIALMHEAVKRTEELYPGADISLSAQLYLEKFYNKFGFTRVSGIYDEDGIPHIDMLRNLI